MMSLRLSLLLQARKPSLVIFTLSLKISRTMPIESSGSPLDYHLASLHGLLSYDENKSIKLIEIIKVQINNRNFTLGRCCQYSVYYLFSLTLHSEKGKYSKIVKFRLLLQLQSCFHQDSLLNITPDMYVL
jgi:hypothetical protein